MRESEISSAIDATNMATNQIEFDKNIKELTEMLSREQSLEFFKDHIHCLPSEQYRLDFGVLAYWLIERSKEVGSIGAIENLKRYLEEEIIPYNEVMVLSNISVNGSVELGNNIKLVPFGEVPDSLWKEMITEQYKHFGIPVKPSGGLLHLRSFKKYNVKFGQEYPRFSGDLFEGVDDARLVLTLVGPSAPVSLGSWVELPKWVPQRGSSANIELPFEIGGRLENKSYDWSKAKTIHKKWIELSVKEKKHFRVPIKRLNTAMRRENKVDSAIDLGIALEAVFLPDRGPDHGEIGFTLRVRAARFLKHDLISRKEIAFIVKNLYRIRSDAVHKGEIERFTKRVDNYSMIEMGYPLIAQAIEQIIINGKPEWEEVVFG